VIGHDQGLGLFPKDLGFGIEAVQEAVERIMVSGAGRGWLDTSGLGAGEGAGRDGQELDVIFRGAAWEVHTPIIGVVNRPAN